MLEDKVLVINSLGLHARAAAQLVRVACKFSSNLSLVRSDNYVMADAKSILSILTLAAAKGTQLSLKAEGNDEDEAMAALRDFFGQGFGEL
jgi:phosphocarrier protein HPr